jgi:hypothetical protein
MLGPYLSFAATARGHGSLELSGRNPPDRSGEARELAALGGADNTDRREIDTGTGTGSHRLVDNSPEAGEICRACASR